MMTRCMCSVIVSYSLWNYVTYFKFNNKLRWVWAFNGSGILLCLLLCHIILSLPFGPKMWYSTISRHSKIIHSYSKRALESSCSILHFPTLSKDEWLEDFHLDSNKGISPGFLHGGLTWIFLEFWLFLLRRPWRTAWIENLKTRLRFEGWASVFDTAVYKVRHTRVQVQA